MDDSIFNDTTFLATSTTSLRNVDVRGAAKVCVHSFREQLQEWDSASARVFIRIRVAKSKNKYKAKFGHEEFHRRPKQAKVAKAIL